MPMHYGMPHPAMNVGDLIESLKALPPDAPIAMTEVTQDWGADDPFIVTTLTLKVWGNFSMPSGRQGRIESKPKALPKQPARLT